MTEKKSRRYSICLSVLFLVFIVCFAALSIRALSRDVDSSSQGYIARVQQVENPLRKNLDTLTAHGRTTDFPEGMLENLKGAYAYNPDTIGYLRIPGTPIDMLITQGTDNDHYLKVDYYGDNTKMGNAFLDYRCSKTQLSKNTILYGHNSNISIQVFSPLSNYLKSDYFVQNPIMEYATLYETTRFKIFAVFMVGALKGQDNGYAFNYFYPNIPDNKMAGYFEQVKQRSVYFTGVECKEDEKLLTLSTCIYEMGREIDSRLVIVGRPLREGEAETVDASLIEQNPNYRRPQAWYTSRGLKNPYANSDRWYPY